MTTSDNLEHSPTATSIQIVCYEEQGQLCLAVLTGEQNGKKSTVINEDNQTLQLIAARIVQLGEQNTASTEFSKILSDIKSQAQSYKFDLPSIWNKCNPEEKYSLEQLITISQKENTLPIKFALRRQLINEPLFFKRAEADFIARTQPEIDKLVQIKQSRKKDEQQKLVLVDLIKKKILDPETKFDTKSKASLRPLMYLAAQKANLSADQRRFALDLIRIVKSKTGLELTGTPERQAYSLLHKLQLLDGSSNLSLIRYDYDLPHSNSALNEAQQISNQLEIATTSHSTLDLTNLPCITIDDITTRDMDDALSLEKTATGYRLGIHIANVAEFITPNSALEKEAAKRVSSIYMPDTVYHILPELLACSTLSLVPNQIRPCLSVLVNLTNNFEAIDSTIVQSKILVKHQLNYTLVDQILHQESNDPTEILDNLYQIACSLEAKRLANGGFKVPKKDATIRVSNTGAMHLEEVDENSPAHSLIGEFMILANQTLAAYAQTHKLALIFRHQPAPDQTRLNAADQVPEGLAQEYAMRLALKPSQTGLVPRPHSTLGLNAYAQLTSPIRRYGDLCNQRQIIQHLQSGAAYYNENQLYKLLEKLEQNQALAAKAQYDGKRLWLLKYLQHRKKSNANIFATVLRTDGRLPLIQLDELYLTTLCHLNKTYKPGDRVELKISRISPVFGEIELVEQ